MSLLDTDFNNGLSRDQGETVKSDKTVKRVGVMGGGLVSLDILQFGAFLNFTPLITILYSKIS